MIDIQDVNSNNRKNSLTIELSKEEFMKQSIAEQNWILFQAINYMNHNGCKWAKKQWRKVYFWGSVFGLIGGMFVTFARFVFIK